jgi:hypothetical protein
MNKIRALLIGLESLLAAILLIWTAKRTGITQALIIMLCALGSAFVFYAIF